MMNDSKKTMGFLDSNFGIQFLDQSSDQITIYDENFILKYFNPAAQKLAPIMGITGFELGKDLSHIFEGKFWKDVIRKVLKGEKLNFKRNILIGENKYTFQINVFTFQIKNSTKNHFAIQSKELNIQPYHSLDLLNSDHMFQSFFETSPVGITIRKFHTQELKAFNPKICELFGCSEEEFCVKVLERSTIVKEEDTQKIAQQMKLLKDGKIQSFKIEKKYRNLKTGKTFWGRATRSKFTIWGEDYQLGILEDISTQKKYEIELIKKEAKVRAIFNSTTDKILAVDKNLNLIDFNESAAKIIPQVFGIEKLELGIKMIPKDPIRREMIQSWIESALAGKEVHGEDGYIDEKGEVKRDHITFSPIQNKNGEIIGASIYGKNISDLEKANKKVLETQVQLEAAQKIGKIGTVNYNTKNEKFIWSVSALHLIDFQKEDPPPTFEECISLIHPEDLAGITEVIYSAIRTSEPIDHVARTYTKKGRLIYVRAKAKAVFEEENIVSIEGTIQDITLLKEIEENIENTTQKYRDLFNNVNDAIVITNQDGLMIDCNFASEKLLGYPMEELKTLFIKDIVHPDDKERSKLYLEKLVKDGSYTNYQGRTISKDGSINYLQVNSSAILDENGKMVGSRDIVRDISQLKKAEEKREQLLVELAEVNKELKDFAYIVSHDLKAPLRAITNISNWLSEDYKNVLDEKGQQQLQLLSNRVSRMHDFINGIFEYTKMSRVKETKEIVNLNKVIHNASLMLNLKNNVKLNIVKPLPEIYCEKIKIDQVFQNLISNAVKHNDKNICKIDIDFEKQQNHYLFRITDNGVGIEEKNYEKIFQIFQTLQSKDDFESTGIGLTIVKKIIQLHGGQISVHSELGKSTTFEFTIEK